MQHQYVRLICQSAGVPWARTVSGSGWRTSDEVLFWNLISRVLLVSPSQIAENVSSARVSLLCSCSAQEWVKYMTSVVWLWYDGTNVSGKISNPASKNLHLHFGCVTSASRASHPLALSHTAPNEAVVATPFFIGQSNSVALLLLRWQMLLMHAESALFLLGGTSSPGHLVRAS